MDGGSNTLITAAWVTLMAMLAFAFIMGRRAKGERTLRLREQAMREEFAAYARLDTVAGADALTPDARSLARRVCAAVAKHNPCHQAALLLRDAEQRLKVAGSAGVDDLLQRALDEWGERFVRERRGQMPESNRRRSYTVTLGPMENFDSERRYGALGCRQVVMLPLWSASGVMLGTLAACPSLGDRVDLEQALPPLEALADTLARAMENAALAGRLLRAEKMAGLGQLARGVAHELNNPLTAVLGHAELLSATAAEPRVREDAQTIVTQALRMKETVESLLEFWRPVNPCDATVDLCALLAEVKQECQPELMRRGVSLSLETDDAGPALTRGHAGRLRQMLQHLLNSSAQAVAAKPRDVTADSAQEIRITLAREQRSVQIVLSDTGAGFADPTRVFDPFYAAHTLNDGQGMGLAVSYGVVREHGGEISAFNLHPRGAAVVVELPLAQVLSDSGEHLAAA